MRQWLRQHARTLFGTLRQWLRTPIATALNVSAIAIALALPLAAWVMLTNGQRLGGQAAAPNPQLSIFLTPDATAADAARIETALKREPELRSVRFVPKDEALLELRRSPPVGEIAAALGENPLPDAFVVELGAGNPAGAERLAAELKQLPKVALVQLDSLWVQRLDALLRVGSMLVRLLAIVLGVGLAAVTFNTIRLQILTQREEIALTSLLGGTRAYVRRPFLYQGALLGGASGLVALGLIAGALELLNPEISRLAATYGTTFQLQLPPASHLIAVAGSASALGWMGAYLSASVHIP